MSSPIDLAGTSAIVTGAASALGAATARALANAGASVTGIDLEKSIPAAEPSSGVRLVAADVTERARISEVVGEAAADHPLRTVVNCAGVAPSIRILGRAGVHDLEAYEKVVAVNVIGTFNVLELGAEAIAKADPDEHGQRGVIVNTASIAAFEGQVGQAAYASSKAGVVELTLAAARDLAQHGIRVCTIAPGTVETPMMASFSDEVRAELAASVPFPPRLARPDEFAQLALAIVQRLPERRGHPHGRRAAYEPEVTVHPVGACAVRTGRMRGGEPSGNRPCRFRVMS